MTVIVTGAAGFIGSNIVKGLNHRGERDIIAVDNLTESSKFLNLVDCDIAEYLDQDEFLERFSTGQLGRVRAVFHQGACSDTTESDGRYMMANNYRYSLDVLDACERQKVDFLYASSAATYGGGKRFVEEPGAESPLNVYGYSKLLFDQAIRRRIATSEIQITGFRYFNVYGPREAHKGRMASVAFHHFNQYRAHGRVRLFGAWAGWTAGSQQRDFVSVDDVVAVNLHFFDSRVSGLFNLGTGRAQTFNDVAVATVNTLRVHAGEQALALADLVEQGIIEYIEFPDDLKGKYQNYTQADLTRLRAAGCDLAFLSVEEGVARYVNWLLK